MQENMYMQLTTMKTDKEIPMKLLVPSGKTIQYKINKLMKYMDTAQYDTDETKNMEMMEEEVKRSIISLVNRSILVKE